MPFDWSDLIELAGLLEQQAASGQFAEALLRSAVNRAYFGAFGYANQYAVQFLQYRPHDDPDEHGRLREHLRRRKRKGTADRLNVLRVWRNHADYMDVLPWSDVSATAADAVRNARELLVTLPPPQPRKS